MHRVIRPARIALTAAVSLTLGLGLTACQDEVAANGSGAASSAASSATSAAAAPSSAASSPTTAPTSETTSPSSSASAGASSGAAASGADATATGTLSKVTFTLPQGFKVFDRDELVDDTDLAELSTITGVPAAQLRLPSTTMDLNAVSLQKESGGTSNILLFGAAGSTSVPDEAQAKAIIAKTGSKYVGYRTVTTSLGQAALVESTDPAADGGTITHVDVFLPTHDGATAQLTITTRTAKRAHELAEKVASTVKAAS